MSLVDVKARRTRSCSSNLRRASDDSQPPHRGTLFWNRNTEVFLFLFITTKDYGSTKESVEPEAVIAIAIDNGVFAYLQQHPDRRVSDKSCASSFTRVFPRRQMDIDSGRNSETSADLSIVSRSRRMLRPMESGGSPIEDLPDGCIS